MTKRTPLYEVGTKLGDWTVVEQTMKPYRGLKNAAVARVRCVCGKEKELANSYLRASGSHGCGCVRGMKLAMSGVTHGKSQTPIYGLWTSIKWRLRHDQNYANVRMHEPWTTNFEAFETFILSLGEKPDPTYTLDRIKPSGNYEPGNLRWASKTTQSQNRKNSMSLDVEGRSKVAVGQQYDNLTVLEVLIREKYGRNWYAAKVRCVCGTVKYVEQQQLLRGRTKSCGCFKNQNLLLGAKALEKPITVNGETHSMSEWADKTGVSKNVIWSRINKLGWDVARAVTEPGRESAALTIGDKTMPVVEWCRANAVPYAVAYKRIHRFGWDPARAVTEKVRAKLPHGLGNEVLAQPA